MPDIILIPKGKQGKLLDAPTYEDLLIDESGQAFIDSYLGGLPTTIETYSFGLKGKPKDNIVVAEPGSTDAEYVTTGAGNDTISTWGGNDIIVSGGGNDILNGHDGNDILIGGSGDDIINPGTGFNFVDGGDGVDTYDMSDAFGGDPLVVVDLIAGSVTVDGTLTDYLVNIENVQGNSSYNTIIGDDGVNRLESGSGGAAIVGNGGNDTVVLGSNNADNIYWAEGDGSDVIFEFDADVADNDVLYIDFVGVDLTYEQMIADGYLSFGGDANGTLIYADMDGAAGGTTPVLVAEIDGYTYSGTGTEGLFANNIVDGSFDDFLFA